MRRAVTVICLLALAVVGFYVGRSVAPGVFANGGLLAVFGRQPNSQGRPAGETTGNGSTGNGTKPGTETTTPGGETPVSETETPGKEGASGLWIDVDISDQKVRVMDGDKVSREITCSTGIEGHETPLGTFEVQNRGDWFFSEKYQEGAKYWVSFKGWGEYLFHSIVMDKNKQVIPEEEAKLGAPASHGCIRMPLEDAKWIYDNIQEKAKVVIHD